MSVSLCLHCRKRPGRPRMLPFGGFVSLCDRCYAPSMIAAMRDVLRG